jgi:membrane-associated phospholipid phosphatase
LITYRKRWFFFGAAFVYVWILYFLSNHQSVVAAHSLPLTFVDRWMPFLPWTGWIYSAIFIMPLFACLAVESDEDVRAMVLSFAAMTSLDTLVFMVYPTAYPRPGFQSVSWVDLPLAVVRFCDTPKNCFPSQHVAAAFLTALFVRRFAKPWSAPCFLLAIAIAISTLTTKQHYLSDVIAGVLIAFGAYRLPAAVKACSPRRSS